VRTNRRSVPISYYTLARETSFTTGALLVVTELGGPLVAGPVGQTYQHQGSRP